MSQTTLPAPASKKPKASKKPSKPKTPPCSPHLLPRCIAGLRAPTIPELEPHQDFTSKNINDAKVILMAILRHASYWQVTKKLVRADTGLSDKRTTKALNYLRTKQMLANVAVRKDSKLHGWCFRVDLDGKVKKGGWVLHYSQETDVKRDFGARKQMRREKAGIDKPKPKKGRTRRPRAQKNDLSQNPPKQGGSEAAPLHSYNVIPVEAEKKETPFIPASGENFQSLPGERQDSQDSQDSQEEVQTIDPVATEPQDNPDRQDPQGEVQTTDPVREDVLEIIEDYGYPRLDPVKAPAFYTRLGMRLDEGHTATPSVEFFSKAAIQQLQQGPRPRGKAALRWFRQNLPGQLLEDCLQARETLTVTVAHKLVRKLHQGTLSIDHFARYWAAVKTQRCKRQPLTMVVEFLQSTFSVKDERDAEWVTSAAARVHDEFGPALYREKRFSSMPGEYIPGLGRDTVTRHWAPAELCTYLHTYRPARLSDDDPERLLWATRIRVMIAVFGRDNTAIAPLARDLVFSGITDQDIQRWLIENHWGRQAFFGIHTELQEKHKFLDTAEVFGLDYFEYESRVWLLWLRMQTVRVSQENLMYPDMNIHDFCRF